MLAGALHHKATQRRTPTRSSARYVSLQKLQQLQVQLEEGSKAQKKLEEELQLTQKRCAGCRAGGRAAVLVLGVHRAPTTCVAHTCSCVQAALITQPAWPYPAAYERKRRSCKGLSGSWRS